MKYRTIVADPPWPIGDFPKWQRSGATSLRTAVKGENPCPYPTMTIEEIKALPVGSLAAPEAHLYLWTTAGFLRDAYEISLSWGFEPMYPLVWCKRPLGQGLGGKFASNVEFILFCRERHGAVRITSYLADAASRSGLTVRDINRAMGTSDMAGWWLSRLPHRSRIPTWEQWERLKALVGCDERYDDVVRLVNDGRWDTRRCDTRWFEWPRGEHSRKPEAFIDLVEQVSPPPYVELFARRHRLGWSTWGQECFDTAGFEEALNERASIAR